MQTRERGVTMLDTVVGSALMLVIFLGIAGAFRLAVDVVTNNKARGGAIALAGERMEYIRSIAYTSIGTVGGIPPGTIPQSETVILNGVTYTRRTYIEYVDDPKDGLGAADTNGIVEDYKAAKVDVAWTARTGVRHITIVSRFESPAGLEITCTPCGTLIINAVDSASKPLAGASVSIVNASTSPATNINTFTDASGTATIIGAPVASGYKITVSKPNYSTAQTYSATSQNTNPNPGNLTVANNQTTAGSFAIDFLGTKMVKTWTQILSGAWSDTFVDSSNIATSTSISVSGGVAKLSGSPGFYPTSGNFQSVAIAPSSLYKWKTFTASTTQPAQTSIKYRFYNGSGTILIPDSMLAGNSAGFATSTVDLSGISTTTYGAISINSVLSSSNASNTPSIDSYSIQYDYGSMPLPSIAFTMQGQKTIGSGPSGTLYKYNQNLNSGVSALLVIPNLEWDTYTISMAGATGYDIASSCPGPQPETFPAASTVTTNLYLAAHTPQSLLVNVRSAASGTLIPNATVHVWQNPAYAATSTTDSCGQGFFSGLPSAGAYSMSAVATGFQKATSTVNVSGTSQVSITLN